MLFWTDKFSIENKQVFSELAPVLIQKVGSPIKHTQHLAQFLGNQKTPIGYVSSEDEEELKIGDNKCTRSTPQRKTEKCKIRFSLLVSNRSFGIALLIPN